jgi:hypothetical protein
VGLNKRLTNGKGSHWNSSAGCYAVKYKDVFHITPLGGKMAAAHWVDAKNRSLCFALNVFRRLNCITVAVIARFYSLYRDKYAR